MDSSLFQQRIKGFWGRYPLEMFVGTEGLMIGFQAWDYTTLTLCPTLTFWSLFR